MQYLFYVLAGLIYLPVWDLPLLLFQTSVEMGCSGQGKSNMRDFVRSGGSGLRRACLADIWSGGCHCAVFSGRLSDHGSFTSDIWKEMGRKEKEDLECTAVQRIPGPLSHSACIFLWICEYASCNEKGIYGYYREVG